MNMYFGFVFGPCLEHIGAIAQMVLGKLSAPGRLIIGQGPIALTAAASGVV